jgi:hypothetical protein
VRKWRRSRGTNEMPQVASSRHAHQTAQVRTLHETRHYFIPINKTFA